MPNRRRESGVVLITGLVFMVVLTLIVLALMRSATLEERMAANARDRQLALQAAEAVLRDAQVNLFASAPFEPFDVSAFTAGCTNGYCGAPSGTPRWKSMTSSDWANTAITRTFAVPASSDLSVVTTQPRYFVEWLGPPAGELGQCGLPGGGLTGGQLFRLTARGVGRNASTVFVEAIIRTAPGACPS
jgi:type IV pilus assembly protein PilX